MRPVDKEAGGKHGGGISNEPPGVPPCLSSGGGGCLRAAPTLPAPLRPGHTFNELLVTRCGATGSEALHSPNRQDRC